MEYISIDGEKLMITLSEEDMRMYGFLESGDVSGEGSKCLRKMMKEIEKETGFNVRGFKVEVRVFPSKSGGCELYLFRSPYVENGTRVSEAGNLRPAGYYVRKKELKSNRKTDGKKGQATAFYTNDCVLYRFEKFADAVSLCSHLKDCKYRGKTTFYYIKDQSNSGKKAFYLVFSDEITYANEYNGTLIPSKFYYFVKEHGYLICRDAVSELPSFF